MGSAPREACLTETQLDLLALAALEPHDQAAANAHLDGCERCRERSRERARGFAAFPEVDETALRRGIDARVRTRRASARRRVGRAIALAATCATLAVGWVIGTPARQSDTDTVTAKGAGPSLAVYRLEEGQARAVSSGSRFREGERVRLTAALPGEGELLVVGLESGGRVFPIHPEDGRSRRVGPSRATLELPGAFELDGSRGDERFVLVFCQRPLALDALQSAGDGTVALGPRADCVQQTFLLKKEPSP